MEIENKGKKEYTLTTGRNRGSMNEKKGRGGVQEENGKERGMIK